MIIRRFITKALLLTALALPAVSIQSCSEDAPSYTLSTADLVSSWLWQTSEGDISEIFNVKINRVSDTKIEIVNFNNADGEVMEVSVSEKQLTFAGELVEGAMIVSNGTGIIKDGAETITLEYDLNSDGELMHVKAELKKGQIAKKAIAQ